VGGDETAHAQIAEAAGTTADDFAFHDDGTRGVGDPILVVCNPGLPEKFAAAGMQSHQVRIPGQVIDLVVVDGQASSPVALRLKVAQIRRQFSLVVPDQVSGGGIPGLDMIAARMSDVHDAVVNQRSELLGSGIHGSHPGQLQLAHVALIDLIQRTVAGHIVSAVGH
jgi:hypothetical protein